MRDLRKYLSFVISITFIMSMFAACGGASKDNTVSTGTETAAATSKPADSVAAEVEELTFYHGFYYEESVWKPAKIMRDIYDEFAKRVNVDGAKVKFKPVALQSDVSVDALVKAKTAIGEFPDMVDTAGQPVLKAAIANELVYDIKPAVDADSMLKNNIGINYEQNVVNGKLYTVHDQLLTRGTWYNSALIADPGTMADWNAFSKAAADVRAKGKTAYHPFNILTLYADLGLTQKGRELMNTPLTISVVDSPDFDFFKEAFKRTVIEFKANGNENYKYDAAAFSAGDSAVFFNGTWAAGGFLATDKAINDIKPGLLPGKVALVAAGGGLTISNKISQAKKDLAVEFIKYMVSDEVQKKIFLEVGSNPCNPTVGSKLKTLAEGKDAPTVLLAEACDIANKAEIVALPDPELWDAEAKALIETTIKNYIGDAANPDIDKVYAKLINDIKGLLE